MKKYLIYTLLASICFLTSCLDESMGEGIRKESYTFTAQIEDNNSTRTTVNGNQVLWVEKDKIGIFGDKRSNNVPFTLQSADGTSAKFNGELKSGEKPFFAYYPYQENAMLDGSSLTIHLPAEYVYTGNSNAPMLGFSDGKDRLSFKHLCGLMKVTVTNIPDNSTQFIVTSEGDNPKSIAGTAVIGNIQNENAILSIKEDEHQSTSITYALQSVDDKSAVTFYIPLPVGEYEKLTIALKGENDKVFFQKSISNANIKRAVILNMPALNCDEDISYVLNEKVVQLTTEDESFILSVTKDEDEASDKNIIIYASETPEDKRPKVGDIILYSEITEKFPAGFLGKVTSVEETGEGYVVHTEPAALDEAFDQLYINKTFDLIPQEGEIVQTRSESEDSDGFYRISRYWTSDPEEELYHYSGEAILGFKLMVHIELEKGKLISSAVTLQTKTESEIKFGVKIKGKYEKSIPIGKEISFATLPATIIITPSLQLSFTMETEGEVEYDSEISFSKQFASGIEYKNDVWNAGSNDVGDDGFFNWGLLSDETDVTLKGSVYAGIEMAMGLQLFNNDNMRIGIIPSLGFTGSADMSFSFSVSEETDFYDAFKDNSIDAGLGVSVDAEANANIFDDSDAFKLNIYEHNFWEQSYYLFPEFKNEKIEVNNEKKSVLATYDVGRDLLFDSQIGITLYKDKQWIKETDENIYHWEAEYANPLVAVFDNLEANTEYTVVPYIVWGNLFRFYADPEQTFMLEDDEEEEGEPDPENPLVVTTGNATNITQTSATLSGSLSEMKPDETYTYGFVYIASNGIPTIETGTKVEVSSMQDNGAFSTTVESLQENTTYSWCAYACDASGNYTYGSTKTFTTSNTEAQSERDILIAFYNATNGDNWINNENWCTNAPLEDWYGVRTSPQDGTVMYIDLGENGLNGYADLKGLNNLQSLSLENNQLSSVDVSNIASLVSLRCYQSNISFLNLEGCVKLSSLECNNNELSSLNISELSNLSVLNCSDNQIETLEVSQLIQLTKITCHRNNIKSLDFSSANKLTSVECTNNQLEYLNIQGCVNLQTINCDNNKITSLDVLHCSKLLNLNCNQNLLTTLDVHNLAKLSNLSCQLNKITVVNTSGCISLRNVMYSSNLLTTIDLSDAKELINLFCGNNKLTQIILSASVSLGGNQLIFDNWGDYDVDLYTSPNHQNHYQYPEFIYE